MLVIIFIKIHNKKRNETMITEAYCSYEVAKLLKEKGFDELCIFKYNSEGIKVKAGKAIDEWSNTELEEDEYSAPTHQMVMRWLREIHKIFIQVELYSKYNDCWFQLFQNTHRLMLENHEVYNSYEEATEAALRYVLENLI
jgi:hypothetical protein